MPVQKLVSDELKKLGWIEGRNLRLDFRFGAGDVDRTRAEAVDLARLAPDVIVTGGRAALNAAQQATKTIHIMFVDGDPAELGFVKNIAHPEGNATGFATAFASLGGKWLQLLKEAAPNVTRVALIGGLGVQSDYRLSIEAAARALRVQLVTIPVTDDAGIKAAIESFAAEPNGGLFPGRGMRLTAQRAVIRLAEQHRLPAIYGISSLAAEGGLMSYASDPVEATRGAVSYVDRILRGAKVSELPVQYPTKFRLVINLKTAKAIGLEIPTPLLALADEVIE